MQKHCFPKQLLADGVQFMLLKKEHCLVGLRSTFVNYSILFVFFVRIVFVCQTDKGYKRR